MRGSASFLKTLIARSTFLFGAAVLLPVCTLSLEAKADNAYRWKDSSGRVFYGSRPPKNARSSARIETPRLSRYSADKVLRRLGKEVPTKPRARMASSNDSSGATSAGGGQGASATYEAAQLEFGKVLVGRDADQSILSCDVRVKNAGTTKATDVSVAFEFSDGSLVPGVGPLEIEAGEEAAYVVPSELTPLKLRLAEDQIDKMLQEPRVVVHGLASQAPESSQESATE